MGGVLSDVIIILNKSSWQPNRKNEKLIREFSTIELYFVIRFSSRKLAETELVVIDQCRFHDEFSSKIDGMIALVNFILCCAYII